VRRRTNASAADEAERVEEIDRLLTKCCRKVVCRTEIIYQDNANTLHCAGVTVFCTKCRKPAKYGDNAFYLVKKLAAWPDDFTQGVWDMVKAVGWIVRARGGGGLYIGRDERGVLGALGHGQKVMVPRALTEGEKASADAHQPDPPEPEDFE